MGAPIRSGREDDPRPAEADRGSHGVLGQDGDADGIAETASAGWSRTVARIFLNSLMSWSDTARHRTARRRATLAARRSPLAARRESQGYAGQTSIS
jgi:hypothetical protein